MKFSPLFWPVTLKGRVIYILDETALPGKKTFIKATSVKEAVGAISQMKTRAVGQVLLVMYTFWLVSKKHSGSSLAREIRKTADALNSARPTLPFKVLTDMVVGWSRQRLPLEKCIERFLYTLKEARIRQARQAARLLKNGDVVLTHCHVSGLLPLIGELCRRQRKKIGFIVTETRPYLQGMRLTAWELRAAGFEVTVVCDNMVAQVMKEKKVNAVIVGADHLARNRDIANKIGTYQIAILARHFHIPFYVLCPPVSRARRGADIPIEIREARELFDYLKAGSVPAGVRAYYPAFDVTPKALITKHIYLEV